MEFNIRIKEEKLPVIEEVLSNGMKRSKTVQWTELLTAINGAFVEDTDNPYESERFVNVMEISPSLPRNTVKYALRRSPKTLKEKHIILLDFKKFNTNMTYNDEAFNNVAFPNLAIALVVVDNRIISRYVRAYVGETLRDTTKMCLFPYAHVSSHNGSICYYERDDITDLVELENWAYNWAAGDMGDHFFNKENTILNVTLRELLELNKGKESFDDSILKFARNEETLDKWLEKILFY